MHNGPAARGTIIRSSSYVVNVFSVLASVALILFGFVQMIVEHDTSLGMTEIIGGVVIACNALVLRVSRNVVVARDVFLLAILLFLVVMLMTGGIEGTGIFWFFTFPVATYFLAGKRRGTYWMAALILVTVAVLIFVEAGALTIAYPFTTVRQLLVTLAVVAGGIYAYEQARESIEWRLRHEQQSVDIAKSEFLTLASHQLRTPVSAIKWFSEMLLHGDAGKLSDDQREYVTQVYVSNQRSAAIIDAIITISNLHTGTMSMRFEMIDIVKLCHRALQTQMTDSPLADALQIDEQYEEGLPEISGDVALMQTIMQNILSNAMKYTPSGGHITVSVAQSDEKLTPASKGSVMISVIDTGYGIPKNQQSKIFTQLFRATNIKSKDTDGTGLGLYIVKALLDRGGGRISFKSKEKKGTTFTILLPLEGMSNNEPLMSEGMHV